MKAEALNDFEKNPSGSTRQEVHRVPISNSFKVVKTGENELVSGMNSTIAMVNGWSEEEECGWVKGGSFVWDLNMPKVQQHRAVDMDFKMFISKAGKY